MQLLICNILHVNSEYVNVLTFLHFTKIKHSIYIYCKSQNNYFFWYHIISYHITEYDEAAKCFTADGRRDSGP